MGAHADLPRRDARHVGKEIHVREAGRAALQHLQARETRPGGDEFLRQQRFLDRPDPRRQPVHQRQVVAEPAQQRHRRVRVQVEQPGGDDVIGEERLVRSRVRIPHFGDRSEADDDAGVVDGDRMSFEDHAGRFDRHDPARHDQLRCDRRLGHRPEYNKAPFPAVVDARANRASHAKIDGLFSSVASRFESCGGNHPTPENAMRRGPGSWNCVTARSILSAPFAETCPHEFVRQGNDPGQSRRRDAPVVPRLCDERHRRSRVARPAGRIEAGPPARAVRHERARQPLEPAVQEVGAGIRRRDGQVPSARRRRDLRHDGPHGAAVLAALSADRRTGQLRIGRRRQRGGLEVHRSPLVEDRRGDDRRPRSRDRRLRAEL